MFEFHLRICCRLRAKIISTRALHPTTSPTSRCLEWIQFGLELGESVNLFDGTWWSSWNSIFLKTYQRWTPHFLCLSMPCHGFCFRCNTSAEAYVEWRREQLRGRGDDFCDEQVLSSTGRRTYSFLVLLFDWNLVRQRLSLRIIPRCFHVSGVYCAPYFIE